jgi:hypothetical protein
MKLGLILKLLLGTGVMGLITFSIISIKDTGLVFVFSLVGFVVLLVVTVLIVYSEINGFTSE